MSITENTFFRRSTLTAAGLVVLVLVVLTAARVVGRPTASTAPDPNPTRIESMTRFEEAAIPDQDNAARWLEAGAAAIVWSDSELSTIGSAVTTPFTQWPPETEAEIRNALDRHGGALATLQMAVTAKATSFSISYSEGIDLELPELLPLLRATHLLVAKARVALADGDQKSFLEALAANSRMVTSLEQERTLITALIGIAAEQNMLVVAAEAVASREPWAWQEENLNDIKEVTAGFNTRTMFERVGEAWSTMLCHYVSVGPWVIEMKSGEFVEFSQDCRCADVEIAISAAMELIDLPYGTGGDAFKVLSEDTTCGGETLSDLKGFSIAIGRSQAVEAQRQLLRALIAMRLMALEKGAYPSERPNIALLTNPDPFTGQQISYNLNPDGSLTLGLVGATELLEVISVGGKMVVPVTLPAPG